MLLTLAAAALCLPVGMFCLEVLLALWPRRTKNLPPWPADGRLAVLIPAHNEQTVIAGTLRTLLPTLPAGCRALVMADNCTDGTAAAARQCGAEVIERTDRDRRGKGYALDYGIRHLSHDPPDVLVFLDADVRVLPGAVERLAAAVRATGRPVQGLNLCTADPRGSVLSVVSALAFRFKNLVRPLGLARLTGFCHLTGTGMALPWRVVAEARLADGNVVEDMQWGLELALAGRPPLFWPEAETQSPLPQQRRAATTQRTRWEHGHLQTLLSQSPRLAWRAIRQGRPSLLWLALDLAIPPLSLLVLLLAAALVVTAGAALLGGPRLPLTIASSAAAALAAAVFLGWAVRCRAQTPLHALLAAPLYAAAKLPIYLAFLLKRQQAWIRTERDAPTAVTPPECFVQSKS